VIYIFGGSGFFISYRKRIKENRIRDIIKDIKIFDIKTIIEIAKSMFI